MSASIATPQTRTPQNPPAAAGQRDALRAKHAHAGVAMAVATLTMAVASGIQAVLYLNAFGVNARTDGFFAAFALYATFGVFSQSIRVTSAPLLVGESASLTPRDFARVMVAIALPVLIVTIPLAGLFAQVLAPGLDADAQAVTAHALPLLGGAMVLQLWASGSATLLAVRDRFDRIAVAYIAGAVAGMLVYLSVAGTAGELSLGWSMLAMAIVTSGLMGWGVRTSGGIRSARPPARGRRLLRCVWLVLGSSAVYLAFNALYLVTLAFVSGYDAGDATVLSYAYLFASYLVAGTGFALGMSRISDMRRGALADWREVIADTVPGGFRYSMLIVAPAMAALVAGGATIIGALFPDSLSAAQVTQLQVFGALLAPWTVAALIVNLLLPAMFALGRARLVNLLAVPLVALQVATTAAGGALFGVNGVVGALFVAPLCFAAVLLAVGARRASGALARELARDGLRFVLVSSVCFGIGALAATTVASSLVSGLIAVGVGGILYLLTASRLVPRQIRVLLRAVRPASA